MVTRDRHDDAKTLSCRSLPGSRDTRTLCGFTFLEMVVTLCLLVMILFFLWNLVVSSHHQMARAEDLVQFQNEATRVLDAAALAGFGFVRRNAPPKEGAAGTAAWEQWQRQVVGAPRPGTWIRSWQDATADQDAIQLWVEVKWENADRAGRRILYSTVLARLLVRPDASLDMEVPLEH
jgi:type II secretory pathway component PulJ